MLNQRRYGAQTSTNANNVTNQIVTIGFADFEKPINSYTVSKAWNGRTQKDAPTLESVKTFVQEQMATHYSNAGLANNLDNLLEWVNNLWAEHEKISLKEIYTSSKASVDTYLKNIKMVKEDGGGKRQKVQKKDKKPKEEGRNENNPPQS